MEQSLEIQLFAPGMAHVHRVGLAGLHMTLKYFDDIGATFDNASWTLSQQSVELAWTGPPQDFFGRLSKESFGMDENGVISFAAHRAHAMGDLERIALNQALQMTFLQHNKQNMIPKGTPERQRSFDFGEKTAVVSYRPFVRPYAHATAGKLFLDAKGRIRPACRIKEWLYPGAAERHSSLSGTEIEETPERVLCLLYAPVASLYFRLSHRGLDGKFDARRGTAIVLPHVYDLESYSRCYGRYLETPVERLSADGLGDAGLAALVALKANDALDQLGVNGCTVTTMGTVTWSSLQKTRTGVATIEGVDENSLDLFDHAWRCIPNRIVIRESKPTRKDPNPTNTYFVATSLCRGLVADNIAAGRDWFHGFTHLMSSQKQARLVSYEKGGLKKMVEETAWEYDADKKFVSAVHSAIRNRYGALAAQATKRGEVIPFDREFERMRTGLMRVKNARTLRAELADLFARGGLNRTLQESWQQILPLFSGPDWQRARDLALLALASYTGKGTEDIETTTGQKEVEQ